MNKNRYIVIGYKSEGLPNNCNLNSTYYSLKNDCDIVRKYAKIE